jgi:nucleoside-diphosphate-sugar epimerase
MHEFASRIVAKVGKGEITTNPTMGGFSIISSAEKAKKELNWQPKLSLDDLIDRIWDEYKSRHA